MEHLDEMADRRVITFDCRDQPINVRITSPLSWLSRLPEVLHVTSVTGLAARQGREGHAGECFGGLPEAAGERLVVGGLGVVDLAGEASGLAGPAGAVVVAALDLRVG